MISCDHPPSEVTLSIHSTSSGRDSRSLYEGMIIEMSIAYCLLKPSPANGLRGGMFRESIAERMVP